jgi:hypothetical protein
LKSEAIELAENTVFRSFGCKLQSVEAYQRMNTEMGRRAANLIGSIGAVACLALQALQTFILAPLAGAGGVYFLAVLGLFVFAASVATLSFLRRWKFAALGALLYASFFTWLWWHYVCRGRFIQSDLVWLELPALLFAVAICIRSMANWPVRSNVGAVPQ